jgi:hypothetical protein
LTGFVDDLDLSLKHQAKIARGPALPDAVLRAQLASRRSAPGRISLPSAVLHGTCIIQN